MIKRKIRTLKFTFCLRKIKTLRVCFHLTSKKDTLSSTAWSRSGYRGGREALAGPCGRGLLGCLRGLCEASPRNGLVCRGPNGDGVIAASQPIATPNEDEL